LVDFLGQLDHTHKSVDVIDCLTSPLVCVYFCVFLQWSGRSPGLSVGQTLSRLSVKV